MKEVLKESFIRSLPVMAGYIVLGIGFGIISQNNGYGMLFALSMSIFIYAGSMQYVTIPLMITGVSLIEVAITTLMVNARHLFYGVSMVDSYKHAGRKKPYLIFALTDETYSLVCAGKAPNGIDYHQYSFCVSILNHIYWIVGTLLGVLIGVIIPFSTKGVDFAMTALFITVFIDQWRSTKNHIPAIIGLLSSIICLLLFNANNFLIPSMIAICVLLILGKKVIEKKDGDNNGL